MAFLTNFTSLRQFYDPSEGKYIMLPNGFGTLLSKNSITSSTDIKCPIYSTMKREGKIRFNKNDKIDLKSFNVYENYLLFSSIIFKSYLYSRKVVEENQNNLLSQLECQNIPTVFFSTTEIDKENSLHAKIFMNNHYILEMLKFFQGYGFIELFEEHKYMIDWKAGETLADRRARTFTVSEQFFRKPVKYHIQNEKLIEKLRTKLDKDIEECLNTTDEVVNFEKDLLTEENIKRFTFPSDNQVSSEAHKMVERGDKDKYGRTYVFGMPNEWMHEDNGKKRTKTRSDGSTLTYTITGKLKENCPYVDISTSMYNYHLMMHGKKTLKKRKVLTINGLDFYDRYYYSLAMLPKWIRNLILIDGEKIMEIDAVALHSKIVGKLYSGLMGEKTPEFLKGDSHSKVAELLSITRPEAKIIALSYWNSKILNEKTVSAVRNKKLIEKMDNFIKGEYPKLFEYLKITKTYMKPLKQGKSSNSNMSVFLIDMEVRLIQEFIRRCPKINVIYVYDCVYVKESVYDEAKQAFEEVIQLLFG